MGARGVMVLNLSCMETNLKLVKQKCHGLHPLDVYHYKMESTVVTFLNREQAAHAAEILHGSNWNNGEKVLMPFVPEPGPQTKKYVDNIYKKPQKASKRNKRTAEVSLQDDVHNLPNSHFDSNFSAAPMQTQQQIDLDIEGVDEEYQVQQREKCAVYGGAPEDNNQQVNYWYEDHVEHAECSDEYGYPEGNESTPYSSEYLKAREILTEFHNDLKDSSLPIFYNAFFDDFTSRNISGKVQSLLMPLHLSLRSIAGVTFVAGYVCLTEDHINQVEELVLTCTDDEVDKTPYSKHKWELCHFDQICNESTFLIYCHQLLEKYGQKSIYEDISLKGIEIGIPVAICQSIQANYGSLREVFETNKKWFCCKNGYVSALDNEYTQKIILELQNDFNDMRNANQMEQLNLEEE